MLHFSSFLAVSGPTPGMVTFPAKLGTSCMGLDWNLTLTWDTVAATGSAMLGIGETLLFCKVCDGSYI